MELLAVKSSWALVTFLFELRYLGLQLYLGGLSALCGLDGFQEFGGVSLSLSLDGLFVALL
jgi:hypothetical protein